MKQVKHAWSPWRRLGLAWDKSSRQAFRLFKTFPLLGYKTVVDLGAYDGEFTDAALRILHPQRVVLIEADPQSAARLRSKYDGRKECFVVHAAVTDENGPVTLRINNHRDSSSLLPITETASNTFGKEMREVERIEVPGKTLDQVFEEQGLTEVDLLKVDIQGAEHKMIAGGKQALAACQSLYIEVCFGDFYAGSSQFHELDELLKNAGFRLRSFHECRLGTDGALAYGNALYIK